MAAVTEGTIPLTEAEQAALAKIPDVLGFTREGEMLQAETRDGEVILIHPDGTIEED